MNFQWKPKKYLITFLKVIGWICFCILGLLVLVALAIQIPYIQNKLTQKAISFLENKIGTEVGLERISLSIPKKIVLTGVYLEDQKRDTLLYAGELAIDTDLWMLTQQTIELNNVELTNFTGAVSRADGDSSFNFSYIIDAFAPETPQPEIDSTQKPWKFAIETIALEKIKATFKDGLSGNEMALQLGTLDIDLDEFDLERSIIKADAISIESLKADIIQSKLPLDTAVAESDTAAGTDLAFDIGVNEIILKDIQARYSHRGNGQTAALKLDELFLEAENIDLKNRSIKLQEFRLQNTFASYQQLAGYGVAEQVQDADTSSAPSQAPWLITVEELNLSNNSVQYYDFDKPFQKEVFDASHLWITNFTMQAEDLEWEGQKMKGELSNLAFEERSGLTIEKVSAVFSLTDNSIAVKDFYFKSPNSNISLNAIGNFTSLETISESYEDATVDMAIEKSTIGLKDVYYFAPTVFDSLPVTIPPGTTVHLDTKVTGQLKDLNIHHLVVETLSKTHLSTRGNIQLRKDKDPYFRLALEKFYTTKNDIETLLPDSLIPSTISLPQWLNIKANGRGTVASPTVDATITSDYGSVSLNAALKRDQASGTNTYKGALNINGFQTGKLLKKEDILGALTMQLAVDGAGFTMEELNTKINLHIDSFTYQDYNYKNLSLTGSLKQYFFSGDAQFQDENLDFHLKGDLDYNQDVPKYAFIFELQNADFKALNLTDRPLKARGTLDVDLATADFKVINGNLDIRKFAVFNGKDMYAVDSLLFASIDQKGESKITVRSDIVDADFEGTINLYSLSEVIRRHFNNYFSLHDSSFNKPVAPQEFKFGLTLKNTDLLTEVILPDLDPFVPGKITGEFRSNDARLDLNVGLAKVRYAGVGTDSITFNVTSDKEELSYRLAVRKIQMDSIRMEALRLQGKVADDSIRTQLVILDSLQKEKYVFGGVFYSLEKVFQFRLVNNQVVLNYAPWIAPADNNLQFTSTGIQAHNFSIANINEKISLVTSNDQDSVVSIQFKDLNLQNITRLVEGAIPFDGLANGSLNMMSAEAGAFNSDLRIDDLDILEHLWGNLTLALGKTATGPLNVDVKLEGEGTSFHAGGYYSADSTAPEMNFFANILR
ncbi:MAG TPA: hypothetical protein VFZ52_22010, partial [Chryseolinea sp.]